MSDKKIKVKASSLNCLRGIFCKGDSFDENVLSFFRNLIFFVAIILYFAGWYYCYYFFNNLGISLNALNIPFHYFFIYSFKLILKTSILWSVIFLFLIFFILWLSRIPKLPKAFLSTIIFIIPFLISYSDAKEQALREVRKIRMGITDIKTISLALKEEGKYPKQFIKANFNNRLYLLTETNNAFYILIPNVDKKEEYYFNYLYEISKNDVHLAKIKIVGLRDDKKKGQEYE